MQTLITVFDGFDYVSFVLGLTSAFLVLLIRAVFLDLFDKGKEKKK